MKSYGKLYADTISYPPIYKRYPVAEIGWTTETEEPYRRGYCVVVKMPFTNTAVALGVWGKPQEETAALTSAIEGRPLNISPDEIMEW